MRVAPVSGDLLVKLALGAAVIGAAVWAAKRAAAAVPTLPSLQDIMNAADNAAAYVTPWNPDNLANSTVNAGVSAATGREETLGGWLHDLTQPDPMASPAPAPAPQEIYWPTGWSTGGGLWNNPSAYTAPGVTGSGGAAFGIYPRP